MVLPWEEVVPLRNREVMGAFLMHGCRVRTARGGSVIGFRGELWWTPPGGADVLLASLGPVVPPGVATVVVYMAPGAHNLLGRLLGIAKSRGMEVIETTPGDEDTIKDLWGLTESTGSDSPGSVV